MALWAVTALGYRRLLLMKRSGCSRRAEWVTLMCLIAEIDRELYRELRREAWEAAVRCRERSPVCSEKSN